MIRVKPDMFFDILNLMTFLCLVTYAETSENNQDDLQVDTKMDAKTRAIDLVMVMFMIMFGIMFALLTLCCQLYKINERNRMLMLIILFVIFLAIFFLWMEAEIEIETPGLSYPTMEDKTKEAIHMFIPAFLNGFVLSISCFMILFSAFVILSKLIKKTKAKTTTSDAKLKADKTDYGALKDHVWHIV